jgi:hypothetical protein
VQARIAEDLASGREAIVALVRLVHQNRED